MKKSKLPSYSCSLLPLALSHSLLPSYSSNSQEESPPPLSPSTLLSECVREVFWEIGREIVERDGNMVRIWYVRDGSNFNIIVYFGYFTTELGGTFLSYFYQNDLCFLSRERTMCFFLITWSKRHWCFTLCHGSFISATLYNTSHSIVGMLLENMHI